jgi:MFS transporter, NNP family, nitrate/nitrite transporter
MERKSLAGRVLLLNTLAFAACFAAWTLYGVLITYLAEHKIVAIDRAQIGLLIGIPVLTGSVMRLPMGVLADRFGGKPVFIAVMIVTALSLLFVSSVHNFTGLMIGGLAFGVAGSSFAVGVAYTSLWFPKNKQGTALGLFALGGLGTACTAVGAPQLLNLFTHNGVDSEGWRRLPQVYALGLLAVSAIYFILAVPKKSEAPPRDLAHILSPLKNPRVWRFGFYYCALFGAFMSLSQWLIPYYMNVYGGTLAAAGLVATMLSVPGYITRAIGGYVSDRIGARKTLYFAFTGVMVIFFLLVAPRMDITSPGEGIQADKAGTVSSVSPSQIVAGGVTYAIKVPVTVSNSIKDSQTLILPTFNSWQEPDVRVGQEIKKKQIIARGTTHVFFQANRNVFLGLVVASAILMGLGMAAIYKHIPEYFPEEVGVVGGMVGVIGGLGGFAMPILFGILLKATGLWTSCWLILAILAGVGLVWMHLAILHMAKEIEVVEEEADPILQLNAVTVGR